MDVADAAADVAVETAAEMIAAGLLSCFCSSVVAVASVSAVMAADADVAVAATTM